MKVRRGGISLLCLPARQSTSAPPNLVRARQTEEPPTAAGGVKKIPKNYTPTFHGGGILFAILFPRCNQVSKCIPVQPHTFLTALKSVAGSAVPFALGQNPIPDFWWPNRISQWYSNSQARNRMAQHRSQQRSTNLVFFAVSRQLFPHCMVITCIPWRNSRQNFGSEISLQYIFQQNCHIDQGRL